MKQLQILGTGCAKCNQFTAVVQKAAEELKLEFEIEKITDMIKFANFGVMITPALVVDGVVKVSGKVPTLEETKKLLEA